MSRVVLLLGDDLSMTKEQPRGPQLDLVNFPQIVESGGLNCLFSFVCVLFSSFLLFWKHCKCRQTITCIACWSTTLAPVAFKSKLGILRRIGFRYRRRSTELVYPLFSFWL